MNELMYTNKEHKVKVIIESFGDYARLSLEAGQNGVAHTSFLNLAWGCEVETSHIETNEVECFMAPKEAVAKMIRAFRAANTQQPRRGKGSWKQSPFIFQYVGQERTYYKDLDIVPYRYRTPNYEQNETSNDVFSNNR